MTELYIDDENVNDLDNCDYLSITSLTICAPNNINLLLDKLYEFTNLQTLYLHQNQIHPKKSLLCHFIECSK